VQAVLSDEIACTYEKKITISEIDKRPQASTDIDCGQTLWQAFLHASGCPPVLVYSRVYRVEWDHSHDHGIPKPLIRELLLDLMTKVMLFLND
jgi:hypothetical protein